MTFSANCVCKNINLEQKTFVNDWQKINCKKCESDLIISKENEIVIDFNNKSNVYEAKCECNDILHYRNKILKDWASMKCMKCIIYIMNLRGDDNCFPYFTYL